MDSRDTIEGKPINLLQALVAAGSVYRNEPTDENFVIFEEIWEQLKLAETKALQRSVAQAVSDYALEPAESERAKAAAVLQNLRELSQRDGNLWTRLKEADDFPMISKLTEIVENELSFASEPVTKPNLENIRLRMDYVQSHINFDD